MTTLKGAKVLVTGGKGFLGTFVCAMLEQHGAKALPVSRQTGYDLRIETEALSPFLLTKPDVVVHLATKQLSEELAGAAFKDNVQMGMNVLHGAALSKAYLVVVSDASIYDEASAIGSAKAVLHKMSQMYRRQYGLKSAFVVPERLYGIAVAPTGIVPVMGKLLNDAAKSKKESLEAPLPAEHKVQTLHAFDAAAGIAEVCAKRLDSAVPFNLTSAEPELRFGDLMEKLAQGVGYEGSISWPDSSGFLEKEPLNRTATKDTLDWEPRVPITEGIGETLDWLQKTPAAAR